MAFPDVELVLMSLLDDLGYTCTALPGDDEFEDALPIIVCNRIGGGSDGITDAPLAAVMVIAKSRPEAWRVSSQIRDRILNAGCTEVDGILIDTTREVQGNNQIPDINPDNRFVDANYILTFRQIRGS